MQVHLYDFEGEIACHEGTLYRNCRLIAKTIKVCVNCHLGIVHSLWESPLSFSLSPSFIVVGELSPVHIKDLIMEEEPFFREYFHFQLYLSQDNKCPGSFSWRDHFFALILYFSHFIWRSSSWGNRSNNFIWFRGAESGGNPTVEYFGSRACSGDDGDLQWDEEAPAGSVPCSRLRWFMLVPLKTHQHSQVVHAKRRQNGPLVLYWLLSFHVENWVCVHYEWLPVSPIHPSVDHKRRPPLVWLIDPIEHDLLAFPFISSNAYSLSLFQPQLAPQRRSTNCIWDELPGKSLFDPSRFGCQVQSFLFPRGSVSFQASYY